MVTPDGRAIFIVSVPAFLVVFWTWATRPRLPYSVIAPSSVARFCYGATIGFLLPGVLFAGLTIAQTGLSVPDLDRLATLEWVHSICLPAAATLACIGLVEHIAVGLGRSRRAHSILGR